jgi:hypothetical protein
MKAEVKKLESLAAGRQERFGFNAFEVRIDAARRTGCG